MSQTNQECSGCGKHKEPNNRFDHYVEIDGDMLCWPCCSERVFSKLELLRKREIDRFWNKVKDGRMSDTLMTTEKAPDVNLILSPEQAVMIIDAWSYVMKLDDPPFRIPEGCNCRVRISKDRAWYEHSLYCPVAVLTEMLERTRKAVTGQL